MSLHLYLKSFEAPLGERGKDNLWREKRELLDDTAKCAERIAEAPGGAGGTLVRGRARRRPRHGGETRRRGGGGACRRRRKRRLDTKRMGALPGTLRAGVRPKAAPARRHGHERTARGTPSRRRRFQPGEHAHRPREQVRRNRKRDPGNSPPDGARAIPALAITSSGPSKLAAMVAEANLEAFPHPDEVGGRFTAAQNNALLAPRHAGRRYRAGRGN